MIQYFFRRPFALPWLLAGVICALPACAAEYATTAPAGPNMELVQTVSNGPDGINKLKHVTSIAYLGDFLYVSAGNAGWVTWFKRDLDSGKLTWIGELEFGQRLKDAYPEFRKHFKWGWNTTRGCLLASAGGRLYVAPCDGGGLAWCEIDPKTGQPMEKGLVQCFPSYGTAVSPDQKNLYIKYQPGPDSTGAVPGCVFAYRIDGDGNPAQTSQVTNEGITWASTSPLRVSPDGKFLYLLGPGLALVCCQCKPNGEISYLETLQPPSVGTHYQLGSLDFTPDASWAYISTYWEDKTKFMIARRDADSGKITPVDTTDNGPKGKIEFLPDGSGGYWACSQGVIAFTRDAATGRLTQTGIIKLTKPQDPPFVYDPANGFLYVGGDQLDVIKARKMAAK